MNQENAKDFLPLIQALAEGKTIQQCDRDGWIDIKDPCFCEDVRNYRIKPEVEYVPFDTVEELVNCWCQIRFDGYKPYNTELEMPLIWVKNKLLSNSKLLLVGFENNCVSINGCYHKLEDIFEYYTFLDGSPIGRVNGDEQICMEL